MNRFFLSLIILLGAVGPACAQTAEVSAPFIACPPPTTAAPIWGKLVVSGNLVTSYYATGTTTPTVWTQAGAPQTIGFINNPLLVGICITSRDGNGTATLATGTVDNFLITPAPKFRLADVDIGGPQLMGSSNLINNVWNLSGSGVGITGTSDQFNFQPWLVWGDCTVICRMTSLNTSNVYGKIGIMVRDGFNSGSDFALLCATESYGVDFQYRPQFINNNDQTQFVAPPAPGIVSSIVTGYGLTGSTSYVVRP